MTAVDPFPRVLEDIPVQWDVFVQTATDVFVVDQWTSLSVTDSVDGPRCELEVSGVEPMLPYMRMMVADLLLYRNNELLYRFRIADANDTGSRDAHNVKFSAVGYEQLLARRVLHKDLPNGTGSNEVWVLTDEDIDAAWRLITYTQDKMTFGITRGTLTAGTTRQRTLHTGDTILEAVNEFASAEDGFDWWIDANRVFWAAKPRRGVTHDIVWRWGNEIAELERNSAMEDYASRVLTLGAQQETKIPNPPGADVVYPPPPPQTVELDDMPLGLWEVAYSYSDVITTGSLLEKANWHLADLANVRPTYKLTLEPGIWTPDFGLGDIVTMRIEAPPRLDLKVPVRIEEIGIGLTADGGEVITMSVRCQEAETFLTAPEPSMLDAPTLLDVGPPGGRTVQRHRLRPVDELGAMLRNTEVRLGRQERSLLWNQGSGTGGGGTADGLGPDGDKGDVTVGGGGTTLSIDNDAVTNAKLANMPPQTIKGNNTGSTGDPLNLTATQTTAMLDLFTSTLKGLAPASGGGTAKFLRADGTWIEPPGDEVIVQAADPGLSNTYELWVDTDASPAPPQTGHGTLVGEMKMWPGATVPSMFLPCNGALVSRTTYADLFSALGTTWGAGDGTTTFALPDMRGRAPIGVGQGTGLTNRALAAQVGAETVTLAVAHLPAHSHPVNINSGNDNVDHAHNVNGNTGVESAAHWHTAGGGATNFVVQQFTGGGSNIATTPGSGVPGNIGNTDTQNVNHVHGVNINSGGRNAFHQHNVNGNTGDTGSGTAVPNVPPSVVVNFIIFTGVP